MTDGAQWGPPPPPAGYGGPEQPGYGGPPYGQPPYGQPPYGQPPYGQPPYGQAAYGQPPPGYPPAGYGQFPQGQAPYGQFPYGPPGFGGWPPARRPSVVTAAGVLGIVTGGLTAFVSLIMLIAVAGGEDDVATLLLTLGLPCAVGLITGGVRVLQGHAPRLLFVSALAAVGVLLATLVGSLLTMSETGRFGVTAFVVFAAVLPIVTAVLARLRQVTAWSEG
jgi:hypothetical protein